MIAFAVCLCLLGCAVGEPSPTKVYHVSLLENSPVGTIVTQLEGGRYGNSEDRVEYTVRTGHAGDYFAVDGDKIILIGDLDYEHTKTLTIEVTNADRTELVASVIISVEDVNDNAPAIRVNYLMDDAATLDENRPVGTFVAHVSVVDADHGPNGEVTCTLVTTTGEFMLVQLSGTEFNLLSGRMIDREMQDEYDVAMVCYDHGSPALISRAGIRVRIQDTNDNAPIFHKFQYQFLIQSDRPVGSALGRVQASDPDSGMNGKITYAIREGHGVVEVDAQTGVLTITGALHPQSHEVVVSVWAEDQGSPPRATMSTVTLLYVA